MALGIVMVVLASSLPPSTVLTAFAPQWWPTTVGVLVAALGAILALRTSEREDDDHATGSSRMLALLASAAAGLVLWQFVGFLPAMAAMSVAMLLLLGERRLLVIVLLPLILTSVLYTFFSELLKVPL